MTPPWGDRGVDMLVGAVTGVIATVPLVVAAYGWAARWYIGVNVLLTLGTVVLWLSVITACKWAETKR